MKTQTSVILTTNGGGEAEHGDERTFPCWLLQPSQGYRLAADRGVEFAAASVSLEWVRVRENVAAIDVTGERMRESLRVRRVLLLRE